jgi:acylphosphatase
MQKVRLEAKIFGIVQGIGFRYFVKKNALLRNLTGYVENLSDGRVHVVCEGDKDVIEEFLKFLRNGSSYSVVESVEFEFSNPTGEFISFETY